MGIHSNCEILLGTWVKVKVKVKVSHVCLFATPWTYTVLGIL